jgi:hypothetical protein
MNEADLKAIPELDQLQVLDQDHPAVRSLLADTTSEIVAEATDTVRVFELLHRDEYLPIAAVRFAEGGSVGIRVYFKLLDQDEQSASRKWQLWGSEPMKDEKPG